MFGTKKRKVTFNHEGKTVEDSIVGIDLKSTREKMITFIQEISEEGTSKVSLVMERLLDNFDKEEMAYLMVQLMVSK